MKHFNRNIKAISPIFATLILIAIAVIAGVVVYMFTSGTLATMTGGGTAAQEKVSVQAVQATPTNGTTTGLKVYAQAQGNSVTISNIIVKNAGGNVVGTVALTTENVIGTTLTTITVASLTDVTLASGAATYTRP